MFKKYPTEDDLKLQVSKSSMNFTTFLQNQVNETWKTKSRSRPSGRMLDALLHVQADTQPCVNTEKSMSRQDNLASQERVVVNGRHCVDTEKSPCTQKEMGV